MCRQLFLSRFVWGPMSCSWGGSYCQIGLPEEGVTREQFVTSSVAEPLCSRHLCSLHLGTWSSHVCSLPRWLCQWILVDELWEGTGAVWRPGLWIPCTHGPGFFSINWQPGEDVGRLLGCTVEGASCPTLVSGAERLSPCWPCVTGPERGRSHCSSGWDCGAGLPLH